MPENTTTFGLTIHYADCCGNAKNCTYLHTKTATTEDDIRKLVAHDHVLAEFKDAYRSKDNFVRTVVASLDCDNDHSENPNEWVAPKDIPHMFPNIPCVIVTSRNHMKPKGGKSTRPRFHVFLAIEPITDAFAYAEFMKKVQSQPGYVSPEEYASPQWEEPIPFEQRNLPSFPTEALPQTIRDYALAVAESTQTPVDMSACAALAVMALCLQGKYRIKAKADWSEPLNLFTVIVAEPSERKSPIINLITKPLNEYEAEYNSRNAAELEASKMNKRILEKRQRALEDKAAKGKADSGELEQLARQIASYKERTPLRLYVDDITTDYLIKKMKVNEGEVPQYYVENSHPAISDAKACDMAMQP